MSAELASQIHVTHISAVVESVRLQLGLSHV